VGVGAPCAFSPSASCCRSPAVSAAHRRHGRCHPPSGATDSRPPSARTLKPAESSARTSSAVDGELAAQCFSSASTTCRLGRPTECSGVVTGLVPEGSPCISSLECEGDLECGGTSCPRRCERPRCAAGEVAVADGGCSVVQPIADAGLPFGAACSSTAPCGARLRCETGVCVFERVPEGAPCGPETLCQGGLFCIQGSCGRGLGLGASCVNTTVPCQADAVCSTGTCRVPEEGDPCASDFGCGLRLRCDLGVCRRLTPEGARCERNSQCRRACVDGRCGVPCAP
jgi:hypothetical protein